MPERQVRVCEFCTKHAEGRKWYLEMKNYSEELLHAEISRAERNIVKARTRMDWVDRFLADFLMPATGNVKVTPVPDQPSSTSPERASRTREERLEAQKVIHFGQVLPLKDVEEVIDRVSSITRMPCGCRYISTGKTDKRYCFGFGLDKWNVLGKYPDARSSLEVLEKNEAKTVFREFDEEGLVHSIWTGVTPYVIGLCNCDHDCMAYRGYIEQEGIPVFFRAEYVCQVNWDLCTGCRECMSRCQFGAQSWSSVHSKVYINPTRCFGCGVCMAACPAGAIALIPRRDSKQARDLWLRAGSA